MSGAGLLPCKLTPDPYSASASDRRSTGRPYASYLRRIGRARDRRRIGRASDRRSTGPKFYLYSNRKCHDLQINRHRNGGKA